MTDYDLQQQLIEQRRRQYAGQREFQAPQGQMVGRHYVAPNALQYLAAGLRSIGGMRGQDIAEQELKQLGQQRSEGNQKALAEFLRQSQGTPENAPADGMGPVMPAQAPNLQGAYSALLQAPDQNLRNMGMEGIVKMNQPQAPKWERVELPTPEGGRRVGFVNMNAPRPIDTFTEGGRENAAMSVGPAGQVYNPRLLAQGQVLADPNKPFMIGPDGRPVANPAFQNYELNKASRGAARTNVSVNMPDKKFYEGLGTAVSGQIEQGFNQAQSAVQTLNNANQIAASLDKAIVGPGANQRVALAQVGQLLGVGGKDNAEVLQNTRNVIQGLARQELSAAGQMKGQGQITESERAILRKAEAGQINEFTKPELETFIGAIRKTARSRIATHQRNIERLGTDPQAATILPYLQIDAPADTGGAPSDVQQLLQKYGGSR